VLRLSVPLTAIVPLERLLGNIANDNGCRVHVLFVTGNFDHLVSIDRERQSIIFATFSTNINKRLLFSFRTLECSLLNICTFDLMRSIKYEFILAVSMPVECRFPAVVNVVSRVASIEANAVITRYCIDRVF
jgi:hypothetical protein